MLDVAHSLLNMQGDARNPTKIFLAQGFPNLSRQPVPSSSRIIERDYRGLRCSLLLELLTNFYFTHRWRFRTPAFAEKGHNARVMVAAECCGVRNTATPQDPCKGPPGLA